MISMRKLTLEEKASLMSGANFWNTQGIEDKDIPSIMLTDGPHGLRKQGGKADHLGLHKSLPATCFPTAATLANSWNKELLYRVGKALGTEAKAEKVSVLLGPGMNIKRNPLNGRNFEYFSEDPYLSGILSSYMIQGIQANGVAACAKHFAVNSQELHRMTVDEIVDKRALHEMYLESFRLSVTYGKVASIMTAYNKVNGVYANEHPYLLTEVLKESWGFDGLIVTDWGGNNDRVAALKAGNQLEMPSTNGMTDQDIVMAVKNGSLDESILNERVEELLKFVETYKVEDEVEVDYESHHKLALEAAADSIVLLKNEDDILPLSNEKFVVLGDFAKTPRYQGAGSSLINPKKLDNFLEKVSKKDGYVGYEKAYHRYGSFSKRLLKKAVQLAKQSDRIIFFMGLDEGSEAEGVDRKHMRLPENQLMVLNELLKLSIPVIVVLSGGAPVELPFNEKIHGLVHGYLSGQASGEAMKKVLWGEVNPSGKLAESYPLVYEDVPSSFYYPGREVSSEHRESIFFGYRYFDTYGVEVAYPFGFGLSYTNFEYSNLEIEDGSVKVDITNVGSVSGSEIVQVYIGKNESKIVRPNKELKGFEKVYLRPKETKTVSIELSDHACMVYHPELGWVCEKGNYTIHVASSSEDIRISRTINMQGMDFDIDEKYNEYFNQDLRLLKHENFQEIMHYKLPGMRWNRSEPLGFNHMIKESRYRGRFGRLINRILEDVHHLLYFLKMPIAANNVLFVQNLPYRGAARMSAGKINMEMMEALIMMSEGKFFKGLWLYIKEWIRK